MSYRNYSNCSLRKSISVPFFADPQIAFPQKMQQNRLRGRFFKKSFFGKIEAKAYPGIFHVERIYFLPSPPQKNPLRWWFFNRQASYMSNLGVSNRFFFGDARSRLITCCHGERAEPWELSRPEKSSSDGSDFVIIILKEKDHLRFLLPKKIEGLFEKSLGFSQNWSNFFFLGTSKTTEISNRHNWESMKWWHQKCHAMIDTKKTSPAELPTCGPIATTPWTP